VNACPGNMKGLVPEGFAMSRHELVLYGECAECVN
jgi:Fur family transcriptional regulator, ferric uptake regulator